MQTTHATLQFLVIILQKTPKTKKEKMGKMHYNIFYLIKDNNFFYFNIQSIEILLR